MKQFFYLYFFIYYIFIIIYASFLNIGDFEITYLLQNNSISFIQNKFLSFIGYTNLSFRLIPIILSMFSIVLYYRISKNYLKKEKDIFLSTIIFSLLPGFIVATFLFNKSIYLIFLVLLFIYTFIYYRFYSYVFLFLYTTLNYSFLFLYFALIFYSIYKKNTKFLIYSILLLMINANYFNYDINGHPQGHFIDILLIYFAIFSPFVFIYFVYTLIKIAKKPNLLWFISIFSLLLSFLLSFRQKIKIDDFAPFVIISVIFMVSVFLNGYRVRLKRFRTNYRNLFLFLLTSLILFDVILLSSPYIFNKKVFNQFRYSKQLAQYLINKKINSISCKNNILCEKLYFYGLKKGNKYYINFDKNTQKVSISHNNQVLYNFYVSKLNK